MKPNYGMVKIAALTSMVVLAAAMTARARDVYPSVPIKPPAFSLPSASTEIAAAEEQGRTAYLTGDFSGAILAYTQVLQLRPDDAQAHFNRGLAELAINQNDAAERDFTAYLSTQSRYRYDERALTGYLQRGRARYAAGHFDDAIGDFSRVLDGQRPYHTDMDWMRTPPDLFAFAFMGRAAARYQGEINPANLPLWATNAPPQDRAAAYAIVLADYDKALIQTGLRPAQAPVALFNRALVVETQAADTVATPSAATATARYATAIKGYEAYLEASPKSEDAAQVKQHIAQIGAWLVANTNAPRPVPPAALVLKPTP